MNPKREQLLIRYNNTVLELARISDTLKMPIDFIVENSPKFSQGWSQKVRSIIEEQLIILREIRRLDIHDLCCEPIVNINEYKRLVVLSKPSTRQ